MSNPMDLMEQAREGVIKEVDPNAAQEMPRVARRIFAAHPIIEDDAAPVVTAPIVKPAEIITPVVVPTPDPVVEPVVEIPAPAVVKPEPVKQTPTIITVVEQWQATDEGGKPVGPPSKIYGKGTTEVEAYKDLAKNLREANIQAARKIKEYRDKYRVYDEEKDRLTFEPQEVTAEDRIKVARLLANENTVMEGYELMYKLQFGMTPTEVRQREAQKREVENLNIGKVETDKFLAEHPDFPRGPGAMKVMLDEIQVRKDKASADHRSFAWTAHNLEIVYDDLVQNGLIVPRQMTEQVPNLEPVKESQIAPVERVSQEITPPVAAPATPSATAANTSEAQGNTRPRGTRFAAMSTEHGQAPPTTRQTDDEAFRQEVQNMPIEVLKRKILHDKNFAKRLNNLK